MIEQIRARQATLDFVDDPAEHRPEMLYFGCVDARLDPISDIGISKGRSIIFRNIAALVIRNAPAGNSVGAVLEFFLNHIPPHPGKKKQIVISGHTDCGGLKACLASRWNPDRDHYLPKYLDSLNEVRDRVLKQASSGWTEAQILHALERESVRQSFANLLTYDVVKRSIGEDLLDVHAWVLDTHSGRISEMNPSTGEFEWMAAPKPLKRANGA